MKAARMRREFGSLATELAIANTHFYIGRRLNEARKGRFQIEFSNSPAFWRYTLQAHIRIAILSLCRIFDAQKDDKRGRTHHLLRLVEKIDDAELTAEQTALRKTDLGFLQKEAPEQKKFPDPKVAKLRAWRNKLIAHWDYDVTMEGSEVFLKKHPVDFDEVQQLINEGFGILKRWAFYYDFTQDILTLADLKDDYLFVLESLRLGPRTPADIT